MIEQRIHELVGPSSGPESLGERVRRLRAERGLSQTGLAGDRFTKEYVSQIERGKTRPTAHTIEWLAGRLGVDREFLETGIARDERLRVESVLAQAEAAVEAKRYEDGLDVLEGIDPKTPDLKLKALQVESWARMMLGDVRPALTLAEAAREIAERPNFSDIDRADVLYRLGCCRYKLSSISTATALFTQALELATRSDLPCDRLRAHVLEWRSRCYRRQRDFEAAREDVEHALELAEGLGDQETMAHIFLQASLVAERQGHWVRSRSYAERSKAIYEELTDRQSVARLLNNLGGLAHLLGRSDQAIQHLKDAFAHALDLGATAEAAVAISSLAQVNLGLGDAALAESQARQGLELLGDRVDLLDVIGGAQLALGQALLQQDRYDEAEAILRTAEASFEQLSSDSHRAAVWVTQGDLASARGNDRAAARLYRRAAETLQDFRF